MLISQLITSQFIDFHSSTVLGDVDLQLSVMLVRKANAAEEETTRDE